MKYLVHTLRTYYYSNYVKCASRVYILAIKQRKMQALIKQEMIQTFIRQFKLRLKPFVFVRKYLPLFRQFKTNDLEAQSADRFRVPYYLLSM